MNHHMVWSVVQDARIHIETDISKRKSSSITISDTPKLQYHQLQLDFVYWRVIGDQIEAHSDQLYNLSEKRPRGVHRIL